jgi:hypothetical protein
VGGGGIDTTLYKGREDAGSVESPLTPPLSPLEKGGEGVGSGGMVRGTV